MASPQEIQELLSKPMDDLCNDPLAIITHEGAVVLVGPDGIALALTVDAAERSVDRFRAAISEARSWDPPSD